MKTRGNRRHVEGVVTSDRMEKSVVVEVKRLVKHPLYRKYIRRRMKLMAHDEENTAQVGDRVELVETRRNSRRKAWRVLRVVEASHAVTPVELEEEVAAELAPHEHEREVPQPAETEASAEETPTKEPAETDVEETSTDETPADDKEESQTDEAVADADEDI